MTNHDNPAGAANQNHPTWFNGPYGQPIETKSSLMDGKMEDCVSPIGLAMLCGIHDPAKRAAFAAEMYDELRKTDNRCLDHIADRYGAVFPVPKVPLPPPAPGKSYYNDLPAIMNLKEVVDSWSDEATLSTCWADRATVLIRMVDGHRRQWNKNVPPPQMVLSLGGILTAVLEIVGEQEIACLEAAAFYALSHHPRWRLAGLQWLQPFAETWFADWTRQHPGYRRFARLAKAHERDLDTLPDIPDWIAQ